MSLMLAEIEQQPAVLERTIQAEGQRIARFGEKLRAQLPRLIVLLARVLSQRAMEVEQLPELAAASLTLRPQIEEMVERYAFMNHCVVVGRGLNYANAYEFAIKLMETCYVVAERFSSADFLHGPIAMIEPRFPIFLFAPPGPTLKGTKEMLARLAALKAETVVISSEATALKAATRALRIPQ